MTRGSQPRERISAAPSLSIADRGTSSGPSPGRTSRRPAKKTKSGCDTRPPLLKLGRIPLHSAVDCGVVDRNAALAQHLLEIAIADAVAAVPAHRPQDHLAGELPPLEGRHPPPSSHTPGP